MSPDIDLLSDLFVGVINLISMEEHAHFSWVITKDKRWLEVKDSVATIRKRQMDILERKDESQLHCFLKHNMAAIARCWEVGDKFFRDGKYKEAMEFYEESAKLIEIFYNLNFQEPPKKNFIEKVMGKK